MPRLNRLLSAMTVPLACLLMGFSLHQNIIGFPSTPPTDFMLAKQKPMSASKHAKMTTPDFTLDCELRFDGPKLIVIYSLVNQSSESLYVLDAYPWQDPQTGKRTADYTACFLCASAGKSALLLKGIPPLPAGKTVAVRVMPLGTKVLPGKRLERSVEVAFPIKEQSPWYYGPLNEDDYETSSIATLVFRLHLLKASVPGFVAKPVPYDARLFSVKSASTVKDVAEAEVSFNVTDLPLLKRKDRFSRL